LIMVGSLVPTLMCGASRTHAAGRNRTRARSASQATRSGARIGGDACSSSGTRRAGTTVTPSARTCPQGSRCPLDTGLMGACGAWAVRGENGSPELGCSPVTGPVGHRRRGWHGQAAVAGSAMSSDCARTSESVDPRRKGGSGRDLLGPRGRARGRRRPLATRAGPRSPRRRRPGHLQERTVERAPEGADPPRRAAVVEVAVDRSDVHASSNVIPRWRHHCEQRRIHPPAQLQQAREEQTGPQWGCATPDPQPWRPEAEGDAHRAMVGTCG
jgi:hypothetical protein